MSGGKKKMGKVGGKLRSIRPLTKDETSRRNLLFAKAEALDAQLQQIESEYNFLEDLIYDLNECRFNTALVNELYKRQEKLDRLRYPLEEKAEKLEDRAFLIGSMRTQAAPTRGGGKKGGR